MTREQEQWLASGRCVACGGWLPVNSKFAACRACRKDEQEHIQVSRALAKARGEQV